MMKIAVLILCALWKSSFAFISQNNIRPRSADNGFRSPTLLRGGPEPLGTEGDWTAYLDDANTGLVYYFNGKTGEALWEPPTKSFPLVVLPADMRRQAEKKRQDYIKKTKEEEEKEVRLNEESAKKEEEARKQADARQQEEAKKKEAEKASETSAGDESPTEDGEKRGLMDIIFGDPSETESEASSASEPVAKGKPKADEDDWLGGLFGGRTEPAQEEKKEEPTGGMLGNFFDNLIPSTDQVPSEIEVATPARQDIKVEMGSFVLPHPAKITWGGEDAVFTERRSFGVFDGVSGAEKEDGVPLYSKSMASQVKKMVQEEKSDSIGVSRLISIMLKAAEFCDEKATGATTAICASISEDGFLRVLNLGDSACVVVRNGKIVARSREISHYFDCPYQLSTDSPDRPRDGTRLNIELVPGDLVVMGSDGVFDNLNDAAILDIIGDGLGKPYVYAKKFADKSRKVSFNRNVETPYSKLAKRFGDPDYEDGLGGKVDDVCCVVARYV